MTVRAPARKKDMDYAQKVTVVGVAWMRPIALEVIDDARERARRSRQD